MGGMRALEWSIESPLRVQRAIVLAVGATASAEQIALCSLQNRAIRADRSFAGVTTTPRANVRLRDSRSRAASVT